MKRTLLASITAAALVSMTGAAFAADVAQPVSAKSVTTSVAPKMEKSKKKSKKNHGGTEQGSNEVK